jgi:hypothetical protein
MGWRWVAALGLCLVNVPAAAREIAGWLEWAVLAPEGIHLAAKLDTGADTTSIGARDIQRISTEAGEHVVFRLEGHPPTGVWLQRPLVRFAWIKRHGLPPEPRPVVRMGLCVAGTQKEVEVTLADREGFSQGLLIGRNFLASDILVDAARAFTREPSCGGDSPHQSPSLQ